MLWFEAGEYLVVFPSSVFDLHLVGLWFGSCGPSAYIVVGETHARVPCQP